MSFDDEAEDAPLASGDQMQKLDMIVAPNADEEAQALGSGPLKNRARQVNHVCGH